MNPVSILPGSKSFGILFRLSVLVGRLRSKISGAEVFVGSGDCFLYICANMIFHKIPKRLT